MEIPYGSGKGTAGEWPKPERSMNTQAQPIRVEAFLSKLIVVTIQVGATRRKVFQAFFRPDGSLFVSVPYFRYRTGILAAATIPANGENTSHVDLREGGKVASHLVKYSHHADGRAHFSQDGKVSTVVRRQSIPLDAYRGHIFSVIIQGLEEFKLADDAKDVAAGSSKRTTLTFPFEESPEPDAVKFVGYWYDVSTLPLGGQMQSSVVGPNLTALNFEGKPQNGFLIGSPYGNARHVLYISCQQIPRLSPDAALLHFYGGFDAREIMDDTAREAGFLAFLYPASDAEELKKTLGTVDR